MVSSLALLYADLNPAFVAEADAVARRLGIEPRFLLAVMDFESGFRPDAVNPTSGATGLIQFIPSTAADLGTTTAALRQMTAIEQLAYVEEYFRRRIHERGPLHSLEDVYMAVLWPAAVGSGGGRVLFSQGSTAYRQNAVLDLDGDGRVTVAEATERVRRRLRGGSVLPVLTDPIAPPLAALPAPSFSLWQLWPFASGTASAPPAWQLGLVAAGALALGAAVLYPRLAS